MHRLESGAYEGVGPLFEPLRFHLASAAVLEGNSPGLVLVDDPARPGSAFMLSPEGAYLAGDPEDEGFNRALNEAIVKERALGEDVSVLSFVVHPESWQDRLPDIVAPHTPVAEQRRHYVCRTVRYDWRSHLPERYIVRRIDRSLLDNPEIVVPDHVTGWMVNNWGSIDRFLEGGFGFAAMTGDKLVSWSLTDCVSGDRCEIGIRTVPAYRRRGLAAATAAAAVEYALWGDFSMVGWHCPETNRGSIATAERVGFEKERDYTAYYAFLEEEA